MSGLRGGAIMTKLLFVLLIAGCGAVIAPRVYPFHQCGQQGAAACPDPSLEAGDNTVLAKAEVCADAGYFCNEVIAGNQVLRWSLFKGVIHVRASLPEGYPDSEARAIRSAAVAGILEWNGHPFRIDIDSGSFPTRRWDVEVFWTSTLNSGRAGVAHLEGEQVDGGTHLVVRAIAVKTAPKPGEGDAFVEMMGGPEPTNYGSIQQVAAHEMGHALGVGHSDRQSDVMYPTLSRVPMTLSDRDYLTVDALYRLPAGATLR